jgi:hypothetical protein
MNNMTATSEFLSSGSKHGTATASNDAISGGYDDGSAIMRTSMRVLGAGCVLAAFALWVAPGAMWDAEVLLMKLVMSLICALSGLALMQMFPAPDKSEIQFDAIRREVRIVDGDKAKTILRRSYDSLGGAKVTSNVVTLWDIDGSELASFPIENDDTRRALSRQLDTLCA